MGERQEKEEKRSEEFDNIRECAIEVYKILGAGFIEEVYGEALAIEFRRRNIAYEKEKNTEVFYKGEKVGVDTQDFIVDGKLLVELKAVGKISQLHESQARSYLKATRLKKGIIINFSYPPTDKPEFEEVEFKEV